MNTSYKLTDYDLMANLFLYPHDEEYKEKVREVYAYLCQHHPKAAEALKPFAGFSETSSFIEVQELFLRSFDIQAITTLDIGFILFGEDYKRGKLLVNLNEEHKNAGNDCASELADHLPNLLRLLPRMKDESMRAEIAVLLLIPAVEKMISEFSPQKIEKKDEVYKKHQKIVLDYSQNYRTMYQSCLTALLLTLKEDFGDIADAVEVEVRSFVDPNNPAAYQESASAKDYRQNIENEMIIEKG